MKRTFVDNLIMIAELEIQPDKREEFLDYTTENLKISRSYPGNIVFDILLDETQPNKVIFYEVWETEDAQQEYMAWRVEQGDLTKLTSMLAGEPKFTPLKSVADGSQAAA